MLGTLYTWGKTVYETFLDLWNAMSNSAIELLPDNLVVNLPPFIENLLSFRLIDLIIGGSIGVVLIFGIIKFFTDIVL